MVISTSLPPTKQGIVLSGMRPTGDLHIGHFEGVLRNWINLQETHQCFYFIADHHATTTELDTRELGNYALDMVKNWLAFGLDPQKATIFAQSYVPEHAELGLILERLVHIGALERMPTFKEFASHVAGERKIWDDEGHELQGEGRLERVARAELSAGFFTYPVLMAADILLYNTTEVPVGEDQDPHIELTRDLALTFNRRYGKVFTVPKALHSEAKRIRGTDGRKMSKSYGNVISPEDDPDSIAQKVRGITTVRPRRTDKGDPYECPVFDLHRIYNREREIPIIQGCQQASLGCLDCKMELPARIADAYADFRRRKTSITDDFVKDVLREGNKLARETAGCTLEKVKHHMLMDYI